MALNQFPDVWLTAQEVAAYIRFAPKTLYNMRLRGEGPLAHKLGGKAGALRYRKSDVDAWLAEQRETEVGR